MHDAENIEFKFSRLLIFRNFKIFLKTNKSSQSRICPVFSYVHEQVSNKAINSGSACSVLFLSTTDLFPARRKILEHESQSSALTYF